MILHLLGLSAAATICMQLSFFVVAFLLKFDKVTDFAGTMNFLLLAWLTFLKSGTFYLRQTVLTIFVSLWALRLGFFLLNRVLIREKDARFDKIRENFLQFLGFWIIQMIWVWTVSLPVIMTNGAALDIPISNLDYIGWSLWIVGFVIEAVADQQKFSFLQLGRRAQQDQSKPKQTPEFRSNTGLWYYSRHPNYFGEIIMWLGIFLSSCSVYSANHFAGGYLSVSSPLLSFVLLAFISGMPLAEISANKRYKDSIDYKRYKMTTSPLIPLPPIIYGKLPMIIRRIFFCEYGMYWSRFN